MALSSKPPPSLHDQHWDAAQEGIELLQEGEVTQAIDALNAVIALQPRNEYAHFFLGNAHYEQESFATALKHYLRALEIEPVYTAALVNAGHALHRLGRHQEAVKVGKQVLARDPNDADGLYLLGVIYYTTGDTGLTRQYFTRFLNSRPEFEVASDVRVLLEALGGPVVDSELDAEANDQLN